MARTKKGMYIGSDRVSDLPCNVIDDILKYLPLRDAVRTSVLSREWRYKWVTTPYLVFDRILTNRFQKYNKIDSIVYQVLLLHKGPIVKFTYEVAYYSNFHPAVNWWLHCLANHSIEELALCFAKSAIPVVVPHHLFTFDQLRHLKLVNCTLRHPALEGFVRLVRLHLDYAITEPGEFGRFISQCPMLEHLTIYNHQYGSTTFADLEIDAPYLKFFCFISCDKVPSICFINTPHLEEVSFTSNEYFSSASYQGFETNLSEFFTQLLSIKKLELNHGFLKFLTRGDVPEKLPYDLSHLMDLRLCDMPFVSISAISRALCLIRSSPNLQILQITVRDTFNDKDDVKAAAKFLKEQRKYKQSLCHLQNVRFDLFSGSRPEMEFLKLILAVATALAKLEVELSYRLRPGTKKESQLLDQLARFSWKSSRAQIITRRRR